MKRKTFQLKNYVIATSVFIISVITGILIFFAAVQHSVEINSQEIIMKDVFRQSDHLRTILAIH